MSRHDVLAEFSRGTVTQYYDTDAMADEIVRLRSTLAALREPSKAVMKAIQDTIYEELGIEYWENKTRRIMYYAIEAAEKEASNG